MATSFGFLSTHPPTQCGLATFNCALAAQLTAGGVGGGIVRVLTEGDDRRSAPGVVHTWSAAHATGWLGAASALNQFDVAVIQHEYGIYPGPDGQDVLPLLRRLRVPSIVVLHSVLTNPSFRQRILLEQIGAMADAVVTMTQAARDRLVAGYVVDPAKVTVIPHGAPEYVARPTEARTAPRLLTWGLLGPGKGIEWALRALPHLRDLDPRPTYTVAGRTHPKILERDGEAYRHGLQRLGEELGVADSVTYDAIYRDTESLNRLIRSADVVVLPYDSREQVTSGVLIEAVAAGIPVVATSFPHAVELLADGSGLVVPHQDPVALATAVRRILTEPGLAGGMVGASTAATLSWPAVAERYDNLANRLLAARRYTAAALPS